MALPPDEEILYGAQCEVHGKRGGPVVPFPKADDPEVKELYEKKKEAYQKQEDDATEENPVNRGVHVPPVKESDKELTVEGLGKVTNKASSTPGAAPVISDNVGAVRTDSENKNVISADGTKPEEGKKVTDPISGVETDISATPKKGKTPEEIAAEAIAAANK